MVFRKFKKMARLVSTQCFAKSALEQLMSQKSTASLSELDTGPLKEPVPQRTS